MFDTSNKLFQSTKKQSRTKFSLLNIDQSLSYLFGRKLEKFRKSFVEVRNGGS